MAEPLGVTPIITPVHPDARMNQLREQIERGDYAVDAQAVAAAIVRRLLTRATSSLHN